MGDLEVNQPFIFQMCMLIIPGDPFIAYPNITGVDGLPRVQAETFQVQLGDTVPTVKQKSLNMGNGKSSHIQIGNPYLVGG